MSADEIFEAIRVAADHFKIVRATSALSMAPDLGDGQARSHQAGLDALAEATTCVQAPLPESAEATPSEQAAAAAMAASVLDARESALGFGGSLPFLVTLHDPLSDFGGST